MAAQGEAGRAPPAHAGLDVRPVAQLGNYRRFVCLFEPYYRIEKYLHTIESQKKGDTCYIVPAC